VDRSFLHFVSDHASDRQMDGQTDGWTDKIPIARPRLHFMQRGKNEVYKNGYRRRSCTSKTTKNSPFRQTCNVPYHHYVLSRMLLFASNLTDW